MRLELLIFIVIILSCRPHNDRYTNFESFVDNTNLSLKSYIHDSTDCGEWGGHYEKITIYQDNGNLKLIYKREKSECFTYSMFYKPLLSNVKISYQCILTKEKQKLITEYINKLEQHKSSRNILSNAPNVYEVKVKRGIKYWGFEIVDNDNSWDLYESFRNKLIEE